MPPRVKERLFYGWAVVIGCFFLCFILYGVRYSFGVFFKSIESEFALSRAETSAIFSVYMVLCSLIAVLGGWALDKYGPKRISILMGIFTGLSLLVTSQTHSLWQLFLSYSLLLAIGTGAGYVVVMATASRWFSKKRGTAVGIVGAGVGLGIVVMNPLAAYLISNFDWRMAFIVLGVISGIVYTASALLLKKDPAEIGLFPDGMRASPEMQISKDHQLQQSSFSVLQASRTRSFWLFAAIWLFWSFSLHLILTHLAPHITDVGISATEAAVIVGLIGAVSIPGRVGMGLVADRMNRKVTSVICCLLQAGPLLWLLWTRDLWGFYLFVVFFSLGYGGLDPPTLALIGDIFGLRSLGAIMGALIVPWGLGAAIGPAVGGLVFDTQGSYSLAFLIAAGGMLLSALCVVLIRKEKIREI